MPGKIKNKAMGCTKIMKIEIPTTERCLEMIKDFEKDLEYIIGVPCSYNDKETRSLIETIKANPNHLWYATKDGLIHYELS